MEKVVNLFKAFRVNEIQYEELFGALTKMLSEEPHFSGEAVQALDNAQQLTPIPVADFIRLRNQLESTAQTFQQQDTSTSPNEAEATKIFAAADLTMGQSAIAADDPTLMTSAESAPAPAPADDYNDEATVIMPMPPRGGSAAQIPNETAKPTIPKAEPEPAMVEDEHATLIAAPSEVMDATKPPACSEEPTIPPLTSPAPKPAKRPEPAANNKQSMVYIGAGVAAVLTILVLVLLWPSSNDNDSDSNFVDSSFVDTNLPAAAPQTTESFVEEAPQPEAQTVANTDEIGEDFFVSTGELEPEPEPVVKNEDYYYNQIEKAVAANNLSPAEATGTATYYLVGLLQLNQSSDKVSDARAMIAKKHLELAKTARTHSRWDEAQQHLDDAFKVRLPDSYLPE
ncbi:MAG: hypothetical protein MI976_28230 [Pseudomonadales bacterium]|nr:hypothetical protein [Pseudomonadales bacterium]